METNIQEKNNEYPLLGVSGLGGWLVLVQVGIYITIIMLLIQIFQYALPAFSAETWDILTIKQSEYYHPLWAPVIIYEAAFNILFLLFSIYILFNLYAKKIILPKLMIIFYSASLISGIIDYAALQQIPMARDLQDGNALRDILKSVVTCAIWIPYFLKSDRVYNTFRN